MLATLRRPAALDLVAARARFAKLLGRTAAAPDPGGDPLAGLPSHLGRDLGLTDHAAPRRPAPRAQGLPSSAWPGRG